MSSMPWFRVYSEVIDDKKIKRVCRKTGQPKALVIGAWVSLLALANQSVDRGVLNISEDIPYSLDELEEELGLPSEELGQLLNEFQILGMITGSMPIRIVNWGKRQFSSDNVTERVRKHRAKQPSETFQKRSCIVIDTDTEEDTEEEEGTSPTTPTSGNPNLRIQSPVIAEHIYQLVTGLASMPSKGKDAALEIIYDLQHAKREGIIDYLKPFYETYIATKGQNGRTYYKGGYGWLDWAAVGEIPTKQELDAGGYTHG